MELQYIVGRLNFRKETVKILGAFPTEGAAREYAEFRGNGLALNSVLFVVAPDKEAMYLSDEKGTPWKSFDRCRVYDYGADREEMLSDICWHRADELIRGETAQEQNGCVLQAPQTEAPVPEPQAPAMELEL